LGYALIGGGTVSGGSAFFMSDHITVLIKQGQHTNLVLDALLRAGFEFVEKLYVHNGRELHMKVPPEHMRNGEV